jgi:hypothetical protein
LMCDKSLGESLDSSGWTLTETLRPACLRLALSQDSQRD